MAQTRNFLVVIERAKDGSYSAYVPDLPGCVAHGQSQELALANVNEAMKAWLATAHEYGDPIPQPKGRRLIFA